MGFLIDCIVGFFASDLRMEGKVVVVLAGLLVCLACVLALAG